MFQFFILFLLLLSSCHPAQKLNLVEPPAGRTLESFQAVAEHAMVVTPNAQATQIGLDVLKKGGNAADAAVAVSFALSVLRPQSTGLGGGGFLLFYDKKLNKNIALDFREFAPHKASRDMYLKNGKADTKLSQDGALSIAIPREVAGLGYIYDYFASGKIAWADLIQPAYALAVGGFEVYPHLAKSLEERKEVLSRFDTSRRIFLPNGKPLKEGEKLIQKDLSRTLAVLAQRGWQSFYQGEIASLIFSTVRRYGGILSPDDFFNVAPVEMEPVAGTYRGYKIVSMPPPSSGGVILIEILNMLENFPLKRWGPYHLKTAHIVTEAMRRGFHDRASYLGDPRFVKVPVKGLIAKDYAKGLAESISLEKATPSKQLATPGSIKGAHVAPSTPLRGDGASPSRALWALNGNESNSTTHFSIVDEEGNAVSSTQTINYIFGSGLVAMGTGIVLNDEMDDFSAQPGVPNVFGLVGDEANAIAPGKIPLSSMTPTLVFDSKDRLAMVLGSPGGPRIITGVLDTILNAIDFGAAPLEAVAAKRAHHQWLPDKLEIEPGLYSPELIQQLKAMGHAIEENSPSWLVMLAAKTKKGWIGVSDPRGGGRAEGY